MPITPANLELGVRLRSRIESLLADLLSDPECPPWVSAETCCDAPILLISGPDGKTIDLEVTLDEDLDAESVLAFALDQLAAPAVSLLPGFAASRRADTRRAAQTAAFHGKALDQRFALTDLGPLLVVTDAVSGRVMTVDRERADFLGGAEAAIAFTVDELKDCRFHPYTGASVEEG
jgi:hypothetical protein